MNPDWFDFISCLRASETDGVTSLVTPFQDAMIQGRELPEELPIDWLVHVGGAVRERLDERLRHAIVAKLNLSFRIAMQPDPVLKFEIQAWMKQWRVPLGFVAVPSEHSSWTDEFWLVQAAELRRYELHARELALSWHTRLGGALCIEKFSANVLEFLEAMEESDVDLAEPPWVIWSRFPAWLRRNKAPVLSDRSTDFEIALFELDSAMTFLRVALSPQDEINERESLGQYQMMVNPTFDVVLTGDRTLPLRSFARQWDIVTHRHLTILEAGIIDHVRESFRLDRSTLLQSLSIETGVRKEFVNSALESLIADGFILAANSENLGGCDQ